MRVLSTQKAALLAAGMLVLLSGGVATAQAKASPPPPVKDPVCTTSAQGDAWTLPPRVISLRAHGNSGYVLGRCPSHERAPTTEHLRDAVAVASSIALTSVSIPAGAWSSPATKAPWKASPAPRVSWAFT